MISEGERLIYELTELKQSINYVRNNQLILRIIYGNNHLAVYQEKVVDFGLDKVKLEERIADKYRDKPVLISIIDDVIKSRKAS